jgi:hypothetical protein
MKILGKPYAGKLHVRFDEGKEEVRSENVAVTLYRLLLLFYSTANLDARCGYLFTTKSTKKSAQRTLSQIFANRNRKLLLTTLTELNAIAAPAIMGSSKNPFTGYNTPAAMGMPITL